MQTAFVRTITSQDVGRFRASRLDDSQRQSRRDSRSATDNEHSNERTRKEIQTMEAGGAQNVCGDLLCNLALGLFWGFKARHEVYPQMQSTNRPPSDQNEADGRNFVSALSVCSKRKTSPKHPRPICSGEAA